MIADAQSGHMDKVMQDALVLAQEVPQTLKDCGLTTPEKVLDLSLEHLDRLGYSTDCVSDLETLANEVLDIVSVMQSSTIDLVKVVQDLQAIVKMVPQTVSDCGLTDMRMGLAATADTCEDSMNKVAKDVSTIVADVSSENWEQALTDAMAAYQDVLATVTACEGSSAE